VDMPLGGVRARLTPAARRRRAALEAQQTAKAKFPNLESKLNRIADKLIERRSTGRRFSTVQTNGPHPTTACRASK
jgi:hypothetical protein